MKPSNSNLAIGYLLALKDRIQGLHGTEQSIGLSKKITSVAFLEGLRSQI